MQAHSPATYVIIYKTLIYNRLSKATTNKKASEFGRKSHTVQLNAAARFLARAEGWDILDAEAMTAKFEVAEGFTRDDVHQAQFVSLEILTFYLNYLYEGQ